MMTLIAVIHILVAIILIGLVLIQDSKGGALGIGGGGSSSSLLGATGAQTLAAKMTRWTAVIFAITCISLSLMTTKNLASIVDSLPATPAPAASDVPAAAPAAVPDVNAKPEEKK
jgi:preprotein translocase subunit SecG